MTQQQSVHTTIPHSFFYSCIVLHCVDVKQFIQSQYCVNLGCSQYIVHANNTAINNFIHMYLHIVGGGFSVYTPSIRSLSQKVSAYIVLFITNFSSKSTVPVCIPTSHV